MKAEWKSIFVVLLTSVSSILEAGSQVPRNIDTTYDERLVPFWESPLDISLLAGLVLLIVIFLLYQRRRKMKEKN